MKSRFTGFGLLILLVTTTSQAAEKPLPIESMGKQLFVQYCASCHGASAKGDGPVARTLKKAPPDLTQIAKRRQGRFNRLEIAAFIDGRTELRAHGKLRMPVWGERFRMDVGQGPFSEEMIRGRLLQLVTYLNSLQED